MYTLRFTKRFESDLSRCKRKGLNLENLFSVVEMLVVEGKVPAENRPHKLRDEYSGCWECHIDEDWLLVWRQNDEQLTLLMTNTGSHEELFHKK